MAQQETELVPGYSVHAEGVCPSVPRLFGTDASMKAKLSYFDAREEGKSPVVRSQGNRSTCWALTAASALEAGLLPEKHMVFSAEHMLSNTGFTGEEDEGGDYRMIMAYLSGWRGPVLEAQMPYSEAAVTAPAQTLQPAVHVQEIRMLEDAETEEVKKLIFSFGPVQTSLHMDRNTCDSSRAWYNPDTFAYYYPEEAVPTHDVLILGWDDAYPASSFLTVPPGSGAWICQNTWGEDFGDRGIFYVSYYDSVIARNALVCSKVEDTGNYDRMYSSDVCGWQGRQGYNADTCWFAAVFEAGSAAGGQDDPSGENGAAGGWDAAGQEKLQAAGFYNTGDHSEYEIWVVPDYASIVSFDDRILCAQGTLEGKGYFTVPLDEQPLLRAGSSFAVIVRLRTEGADKPVAVETARAGYTGSVVLEGKWNYLSPDGEMWEHTEEKYGTNVCLHAYTSK